MLKKNRSILIIDPREQVLGVRQFMFEMRGYRVDTASSSEEALSLLRTFLPGLVLAPYEPGIFDGNAFGQQLRQEHILVPLLLIGGRDVEEPRPLYAQAFAGGPAVAPGDVLRLVYTLLS